MSLLNSKKQTTLSKNKLILFFIFFSFWLTSCSSNKPTFNIIFSANIDGNQDLYQVLGPDFQTIERLTFTPDVRESNLFLSGDSKRLLYSNNSSGSNILDLESKSITAIDHNTTTVSNGWCPSGQEVILQKKDGNSLGELFTLTLDGKVGRVFSTSSLYNGASFSHFSFSPDGKLMTFMDNHFLSPPSSPTSSFNDPILYDFENNKVVSVIDTSAAVCSSLSWSPTEWRILVTCNLDFTDTESDWHIYLFDVPQGEPENYKMIADIKDGRYVLWSPTGEYFIAYHWVDDVGKWGIFDKDGNYEREIVPVKNEDTSMSVRIAAWSPDGKQIIYTAGVDSSAWKIYIVGVDGSNNRVLTENPSNYDWIQTYPPQ